MERDFKGVWIPKEVWLSKDLSLQEKVFLVEIDSLDNEDGCFASNRHFADFFNISLGRSSQIINSLEKKGYITIKYDRKGKEIQQRIIRVVNKLNTYLENDEGVFNKLKGGIKYSKGGYLENAKDNNTSISNTSIINTSNNIRADFENLWKEYPRKIGKQKAFNQYKKYIKEGITYEEIMLGIIKYKEYIEIEKIEERFIKHGATWFNNKGWEDEYIFVKRKATTKDIANKIDFSDFLSGGKK